jgi:hypothetical protein
MRYALILSALNLSACMAEAPLDPMAPSCGAEALQHLVGQPVANFTPPPQAKAVRVIGPDMAVTMDFRPDRLNVEHDKANIITRVACG